MLPEQPATWSGYFHQGIDYFDRAPNRAVAIFAGVVRDFSDDAAERQAQVGR
jgi:hypothetical protein